MDQMVLLSDGFGGSRYYPENSEIAVLCTYMNYNHRCIIIHYLDLPLSYRLINRDGLEFIKKEEEVLYHYLAAELDRIDNGIYDNEALANEIIKLMT
ncbi:hypothetical protein [Halobacillus litoralis]|uniref:hypothetical protein n=1 Tax=Halobacillus litoralis TaxID=45668 RepID=UPI001CFCD28F|nr:hypothetical protein [Halobacillus litoralis]